ncbi:unnamed protein product [Ophioblennius macclurei]
MGKKRQENQQDPDPKYGDPMEYDPTFNGPVHNRGCTDIICCILFMAVILAYIAVGGVAWVYGDPRHVLYAKNSTGWFCGIGENHDRPHLFYFDLLKCATSVNLMASALNGLQCPTTQVCVKACPSEFGAALLLPTASPASVFNQDLCVPSLDLQNTELTVSEILDKELCPLYYIPSSSVLGRCLPDFTKLSGMPTNFSTVPGLPASINDTIDTIRNGTGDLIKGVTTKDFGMRVFEDFATSWPWILICLVIAMAVSLVFLLLLRFIAPIMVWVLIVGLLVAGAYGIWHCYWQYDLYKSQAASIHDIGFTTNFGMFLRVQETWLAFLIIISIVEGIVFLMVVFLRTRIRIAIALIQEASKAISYMMSSLLFPLVTFVLLLVCLAYWGTTALYLATSGDPIYRVVALNSTNPTCQSVNGSELCDPQNFNTSLYPDCPSASCIFIKYDNEGIVQQNVFYLQLYNIFAFLWCANFVIALGHCTLAGAFASYYWAFNKPADIPAFPVTASFMRALRYHVGSLAFGAFILTVIQIVRIVLEYIDNKLRASQNSAARFIMRCLKCCFWCLEKFVKFLNRNAYIMIAIYGKNFCVSARDAFMLLLRNAIRVVVLDKVTDLLLFFGKLLVVGGVGVLSFYLFSGEIDVRDIVAGFNTESLHFYWMPIVTVVLGSYLIAHGFFSVYNMCVGTLFLCFLEDLERNDGSLQKPYLMSKDLQMILSKTNERRRDSS